MNRKQFLAVAGTLTGLSVIAKQNRTSMQPQKFFFEDDGIIPNNKLPALIYKNAFDVSKGAVWLKEQFAQNDWTNSWRNGIYSYHHYHSTSHEVLGVYSGNVTILLGGKKGETIKVKAGDVFIIPAGVGHKNIESKSLGVVGAYPEGRSWDINRGEPGERPKADANIAALPIPQMDPLFGKEGLPGIWK